MSNIFMRDHVQTTFCKEETLNYLVSAWLFLTPSLLDLSPSSDIGRPSLKISAFSLIRALW